MKRLIDANALIKNINNYYHSTPFQHPGATWHRGLELAVWLLLKAPTVDAVEVEQYNDLREAFVDYVCSGVPNPAPYCKNRCHDCIDSRGWCVKERCTGFNPDGERRE